MDAFTAVRGRIATVGVRRLGALRVVHPFPTAANLVATLLLATVASHGRLNWPRTVLLCAVMLGIQSAIGAANDVHDVELDRLSKPGKPIVSGAISRSAALSIAVGSAGAAMLIAVALGPAAWCLAAIGLGCGLLYDLRWKGTTLSFAPYLVAFTIYPLWVWTALGLFERPLLWEIPLAALLGLSLYLGNTAPDVLEDSAAGVAGLAQQLGLRRALTFGWASYALALMGGMGLTVVVGFDLVPVSVGVGAGLLALLGSIGAAGLSHGKHRLELAWDLEVVGTILFAAGCLAGLPRP